MPDDILDLDEVTPEVPPLRFRFGGREFTCVNPEGLDIRTLDELTSAFTSESQANDALRFVLGADQFAQLDELSETFTIARFNTLMTAWYEHHGISAGKSSGSGKSSKSTKKL